MHSSIRSILVDDEQHCLDILAFELEQFPDIKIVAQCADGKQAIAAIKKHRPDLVFLDIDMPYISGFDVIKALDDIDFEVIFVTAFDQYALKAFRYSALDYLLKPVDEEDLAEAIEKLRKTRGAHMKETQLNFLFNTLLNQESNYNKIILPTREGLEFIHLDEIIRCQADSNYTHIYLDDGRRLVMARTLKDVEKLIDDPRFFRAHQSHLIHLNKIKRYARGDGGHLVMSNDSIVHVARSKKEMLLNKFG